MNMRTLLAVMGTLFLVLCVVSAANAQGCQNQGCQRPTPDGNPNCYTCTDVTGVSCSLSGSCPQSCTESTCQNSGGTGGTDPCASNPVAAGCTNPCINDPNATECCGTEIICDGNTVTGPGGTGGTGGDPGGGQITLIRRDRMWKNLWREMTVATAKPPGNGSCGAVALPKNLLFSL